MITFLRNIILSVIIVFLDSTSLDGNYQQGLAALLVFLCFTGLHFIYFPYIDKELNYLEAQGLIVSMMTLYLGLWTFSITNDVSNDIRIITASVLIFFINFVWIFCVFGVILSSFRNTLKKVKDFLYQRPCGCKRVDRNPANSPTRSTMSVSSSLGMKSDVVVEMGIVSSPGSPLEDQGEDVIISKVNPLHKGSLAASKASKQEVRNVMNHRLLIPSLVIVSVSHLSLFLLLLSQREVSSHHCIIPRRDQWISQ
jgi:hypothetical protein